MKKATTLLLVLFCITVMLTACQAESPDPSDKPVDQHYFSGRVIEAYGASCLVEVTDMGNQHFKLGDRLVIHTNIENCPAYSEGDSLKIVFDGMVAESYPPQILKVFEITVIP